KAYRTARISLCENLKHLVFYSGVIYCKFQRPVRNRIPICVFCIRLPAVHLDKPVEDIRRSLFFGLYKGVSNRGKPSKVRVSEAQLATDSLKLAIGAIKIGHRRRVGHSQGEKQETKVTHAQFSRMQVISEQIQLISDFGLGFPH